MSRKKIIWISVAIIFLIPAILDAVRYLKPHEESKQTVQPTNTFPSKAAEEFILVYNAWGGIYPGLVDFLHKELFPNTYPCNLCYQTFGTFRMKKDWRQFLDSLPYQKIELHKDDFKHQYKSGDLELPAILLSDGNMVQLLMSAAEINQYQSLATLKAAVIEKLQP